MDTLEEFQERIGDGTPYAATLTCTPGDDDIPYQTLEWMGFITFDDNSYNWPYEMPQYEGSPKTWYHDWTHPDRPPTGSYCMENLKKWHGEIVALFERVRALGN